MSNNNIRVTSDGELVEPVEVSPPDMGQHLRTYRKIQTIELNLATGLGLMFITIGIAALPDDTGFVLIGMGIMFITVVFYQRTNMSTLVIDVYADGMCIQPIDAPVQYVFWNDVTNIKTGVSFGRMQLTLYRGRRVLFRLPDISGRSALAYLIQRRVNNALFDYYIDSLDRGHIIDMGAIQLRDEGIHIEDELLRWADIEFLTRSDSGFLIRAANKTYRLTISDNHSVIEAVISARRRGSS